MAAFLGYPILKVCFCQNTLTFISNQVASTYHLPIGCEIYVFLKKTLSLIYLFVTIVLNQNLKTKSWLPGMKDMGSEMSILMYDSLTCLPYCAPSFFPQPNRFKPNQICVQVQQQSENQKVMHLLSGWG